MISKGLKNLVLSPQPSEILSSFARPTNGLVHAGGGAQKKQKTNLFKTIL